MLLHYDAPRQVLQQVVPESVHVLRSGVLCEVVVDSLLLFESLFVFLERVQQVLEAALFNLL